MTIGIEIHEVIRRPTTALVIRRLSADTTVGVGVGHCLRDVRLLLTATATGVIDRPRRGASRVLLVGHDSSCRSRSFIDSAAVDA